MFKQTVIGEVSRKCFWGAHDNVERNLVVYGFRNASGGMQGGLLCLHNHQQINIAVGRRLSVRV